MEYDTKRKMENDTKRNWITRWFQWCPTTFDLLVEAETKILSYIEKPLDLQVIKIPNFGEIKEECNIRTLIMKNEFSDNSTPLVLLHGFASGVGLWILNLEKLSENRTVYALDLLGFGCSSRPNFSRDPELAENQFIQSIEQWRKQANIEKFILLGHSMGGFLATSYAIKYPMRVKHLILADPWGFPESGIVSKNIHIPLWIKFIAALLQPFNPLAGLRAAGPWGPQLVERFRPDILEKFSHIIEDTADVSNYIYHCNAQKPSGEVAFKSMTARFGWAKRPMLKRISELSSEISITFIYGSRSWIDSNSGIQTATLRPNSLVEVKMIQGAGHHIYADNYHIFNSLVCDTCNTVDQRYSISISTPKINISKRNIDHEDFETITEDPVSI